MQVYQMYKDMLFNVSCRIIKNEHDAQDLVHDAFIKAFQNISKLENDLNLGPWLKSIAVNCSLDFLRQKKKQEWLQESNEFTESENDDDLDENVTLQVEEVKKALYNLKDKYRIILVLYLIENYTHREISEQLGINESTVRNQYRRGKRLLKEQLRNSIAL